MEEVDAVSGGEGIQGMGGGAQQPWEGALGALAQEGFEFGKGQFDGVEVRAVGGEIKQLGSTVGERLAHSADLVRGKGARR